MSMGKSTPAALIRVESKAKQPTLRAKRMGSWYFQRAVENRFTVTGCADDVIGRALAHFHPVALRVGEIEFVFLIRRELSADERVEFERAGRSLPEILCLPWRLV